MSGRRLPRPNRRLYRSVEAALPQGRGLEIRIDDFGVYVGRMVSRGHFAGRRVQSADEVPVVIAALAAEEA